MVLLLRVFILVLLLFLLRYLFQSLITRARVALFGRAAASDPPHKVITGRARKDPICGTYVAEELAIKATAAGQVHYFCSPECRDRFLNGPGT